MSDGMMIILIFGILIIVPCTMVFLILFLVKMMRNQKKKRCSKVTEGKIEKIQRKGVGHPDILYVSYTVDGVEYQVKETLKL